MARTPSATLLTRGTLTASAKTLATLACNALNMVREVKSKAALMPLASMRDEEIH